MSLPVPPPVTTSRGTVAEKLNPMIGIALGMVVMLLRYNGPSFAAFKETVVWFEPEGHHEC